MGCNPKDNRGYTSEQKLCTLIGGFTTIQVNITSSDPLPPNLAISLNGKPPEVDECSPKNNWLSYIKLSTDRTKAVAEFFKDLTTENFKLYFPEGFGEPTSNAIDLIFYSRENCTDPHTQYQEISNNNGITWEPLYINGGKHCGEDGYTGESLIDL